MRDALLVAMVLVACVSGAQATTYRVHEAQRDVQVLAQVVERLSADIGRAPWAEEWPAILWEPPPSVAGWQGPYLKPESLPVEPWGNAYRYLPRGPLAPSSGIYSVGANGIDEAGAGDDVSSWAGYSHDVYFPLWRWETGLAWLLLLMSLVALVGVPIWGWRRFSGGPGRR